MVQKFRALVLLGFFSIYFVSRVSLIMFPKGGASELLQWKSKNGLLAELPEDN